VRIAAKRITLLERETFSFRSLPTQAVDLTQWDAQTHPKGIIPDPLPERQSLPEWIDRTHQLTLALPRGPIRHQSNRPIVALLLAPISGTKEFELLAAASNQNSKNRTLHAEVNLIQNWYRKTQKILPPGSVILTSLKPCRMCAALIWQSSDDRQSLRVIYLENDPGKNAQNTALEPQTLDRKLASIYPDEHNLAPLLAAESYLNSQRISKTRTF
jgi:tRNA(Arg) A34 adenosine deaminase TadA